MVYFRRGRFEKSVAFTQKIGRKTQYRPCGGDPRSRSDLLRAKGKNDEQIYEIFCAALAAAVMLCLTSCKGEDADGTVGADGTVNAASDDRSSELTGEWRFDASELTATELAALCAKLTAEGGTDVSALSELLERNFDRAPAEKLYGSMVFRFENDGTATGRLYPEAYAEGYAEILRATFTAMGDLGLEEAAVLTGRPPRALKKC